MDQTDKLILEWLGTGSAKNNELGNSNLLLRRNEVSILVDISANNAARLVLEGRMNAIENIIITHLHGDHCDGLETIGFYNWNNLGRTQRPNLYVGGVNILEALEDTLYEKMKHQQNPDNTPFKAGIAFYFNPQLGHEINIPGFPTINLFRTEHVQGMECYGLSIPSYGLWISGDTREVKDLPKDTILAFRDASSTSSPTRVHSSIELDLQPRPEEEKSRTFLYHLDPNWGDVHPEEMGFAGLALPGDRFYLDGNKYEQDHNLTFLNKKVPFKIE